VFPVEQDSSSKRLEQTNDHVEGRRLPRSVGAEQSYDFSLLQIERDIVYDLSTTINLGETRCLQLASASERRPRRGRQREPRVLTCLPHCLRELAAIRGNVLPQPRRKPDRCSIALQVAIDGEDNSPLGE